jgi:hypothetical protein
MYATTTETQLSFLIFFLEADYLSWWLLKEEEGKRLIIRWSGQREHMGSTTTHDTEGDVAYDPSRNLHTAATACIATRPLAGRNPIHVSYHDQAIRPKSSSSVTSSHSHICVAICAPPIPSFIPSNRAGHWKSGTSAARSARNDCRAGSVAALLKRCCLVPCRRRWVIDRGEVWSSVTVWCLCTHQPRRSLLGSTPFPWIAS